MKDIEILKNNGIDIESSLELLGDMEMYDEILKDFLDVSEERMPLIDEYIKNKDLDNYKIQVHAMKGDSKYLGFTKLAEMALEHQIKSEENDIDYILKNYDELVNEFNRILKVVNKYLG